MSKYKILKDVIDDYVLHMDGISQKRMEAAEKDLDFVMQEVKCFNLLQQNLYKIQLKEEMRGISQN